MIISHKHKFVYIAPYKCASTTIREVLNSFASINSNDFNNTPNSFYYRNWHIKPEDLKDHFAKKNWNWDDYFKFTFVRNPWDRLVSTWNYKKKSKHMWEKYNSGTLEHYMECVELFKKYKDIKDYTIAGVVTPCSDWVYDENGNNFLDFVGKVESLQEDFNIVCDKIGIPKQELPHKNKSKHKHYTKYYDDETREIVAEKFAKDIEYFGYEFGETKDEKYFRWSIFSWAPVLGWLGHPPKEQHTEMRRQQKLFVIG